MKRLPAVFGLGALMAVVAFGIPAAMATGEPQGPDPKVIVCKYVSTPGDGEVLQTGNNPISVSQNALEGTGFAGTFPFPFSDAQGKSVAVRFATGPTDNGSLGDCPTPPAPTKGELVVVKNLVTDDGAEAAKSDFSFTINGRGPVAFESDGSNSFVVPPGDYIVAEVDPGAAWTVSGGGTATVVAGHTVTVTITNDDVKKEEDGKGTLIINKVLVTDDGAVGDESDFSFTVNGRGPFAFEPDGSNVYKVPAGDYNVVEVNPGAGWMVTGGGTVEVEKGETTVVTITNNDVKAPPPYVLASDASVSCVLPDGFYRVSGTVDGQVADKVVPATIPGNFAGSTEVTVTRGDTSGRGTVTTDGKCGNVPTPPVVTPPAVVTPPSAETTPSTVPTAPFTPPKASTKPAAPAKVKKATTAPTKPTVKVAGAVASNPPKLAYTP